MTWCTHYCIHLAFSEKHQDSDWTWQDVCHDVLRHLLQTEAPGDQDAGGVQARAALPQTEALHSPREACWRGRGGLRSAPWETTSGAPADISSVLQRRPLWQYSSKKPEWGHPRVFPLRPGINILCNKAVEAGYLIIPFPPSLGSDWGMRSSWSPDWNSC